MKKQLFVFLLVFAVLSPPPVVAQTQMETGVDVFLTQVEYPLTFDSNTKDNLLLDFTMWTEESDVLHTLVVKNDGSARNNTEITRLVLWIDDGDGIFNGWGYDTEIAESRNTGATNLWVFDNLSVPLDWIGVNFYVSADVSFSGVNGETFRFSIPAYFDNGNGVYDPGEQGIFLASQIPAPMEDLKNLALSRYRRLTVDVYPPDIVITSPEPASELNVEPYVITGMVRDQGGGIIDHVEVCIIDFNFSETDIDCYDATITRGDIYDEWEFVWRNVAQGYYAIYAAATDDSGHSNDTGFSLVYVEPIFLGIPTPDNPYVEGRWIKTVDNPGVYFLDEDGVRHVYPTQAVYASYWGTDFSRVEVVSVEEMSGYPLGRNVPFEQGTLFKLPSVPKVYVVGYDGEIHWIPSESQAKEYFGIDWKRLVVDLPEGFWGDYHEGDPISG